MRFKVGDRVIGNGMIGNNLHGTVMGSRMLKITSEYAVEFDRNINGHNCNGLVMDGHGWFCLEEDLIPNNPIIGKSRLEFKWV